jgi:VWFA-related protein
VVRYLAALGLAFATGVQTPTFHAKAPLVVLPVSVESRDHASVDGLESSDFVVLDNGVLRPVQVDPAGTYRSGVSAVVVIETNQAAKAALLKIKKTGSMIEGYITGEDGEAAVITADSEVKTLQDFTSDGSRIRTAFRNLKQSNDNGARLLDGIRSGLELLASRPPERRRILILISEARDRGARAKRQQILEQAERSNVTIYTLIYSAYVTPFTTKASDLGPPPDGGFDVLAIVKEVAHATKENIGESLPALTGGEHFSFQTLHGFETDLASMGKEIHSQYLLSFTPPTESPSSFHTLQVSVKGRAGTVVRSRPGYWSTAPVQ